jgi:hypothetical protein
MERIDVEELVTWAFRTQAVEASIRGMRAAAGMDGPGGGGSWALAGLAALGVRVQTTGPGLAALGADTADDALVVYDATLRLPGVWVEAIPGGQGAPAGAAGFAVHWADELARAGIRGDKSLGFDRAGVMLDPAAMQAWEPAVLIVQHGRAASRPEVVADFASDSGERLRDSAGRYLADRDAYRRTLADVVWHRMGYAVWHAGLVRLADRLRRVRRLSTFDVADPAVPARPWLDAQGRRIDALGGSGGGGVKPLNRHGNTAELTKPALGGILLTL